MHIKWPYMYYAIGWIYDFFLISLNWLTKSFSEVLNIFSSHIHFRVKGTMDAFNKIVAESGVKGLYRGVVPNVQRAALVNMGGNACIVK